MLHMVFFKARQTIFEGSIDVGVGCFESRSHKRVFRQTNVELIPRRRDGCSNLNLHYFAKKRVISVHTGKEIMI
jgi:hypothetical protein